MHQFHQVLRAHLFGFYLLYYFGVVCKKTKRPFHEIFVERFLDQNFEFVWFGVSHCSSNGIGPTGGGTFFNEIVGNLSYLTVIPIKFHVAICL